MLSSSKYLRKSFFRMYKGFISLQPYCLIGLKSAKVTITTTLTGLEAFGARNNVSLELGWGEVTCLSWVAQMLLATSTVQLLSAATLQWNPCKLWATAKSLICGNWGSHHNSVICIPRPCSSLRLESTQRLFSYKLLDRSFLQLLSITRKLVGFENLLPGCSLIGLRQHLALRFDGAPLIKCQLGYTAGNQLCTAALKCFNFL